MRILETAGVAFDTASYEVDESALDAVTAAEKLGVDPLEVFKTIVMESDAKEILVFCVPAVCEVNLKKARAAAGVKELAPIKEASLLSLTGYVRGGCSPVGMKHPYRTFIDETAQLHERIHVSAGHRGVQLVVNAKALAAIIGASFADIAAGF